VKIDMKNGAGIPNILGKVQFVGSLSDGLKRGFAYLKDGGRATQTGVRFACCGSSVKAEVEDRSTAARFG